MGRELVVDKWVADQAPPRVNLIGSTIHIDASLTGQWSSSADLEPQGMPETGQLLLRVATVFEPGAPAGPNDVLRFGAAGHIFLGWILLT
ncbi:hypothetical protein [Streptomyces sp. TLI_185]|uniref:hypothetical protein n=1 Tax=Streptomyces sp. TLI_185 TaxID=2485151 RepID=UPI000F4DFEBC|nr:hypothetical protein [Streptomyces sp. TLI_185]RPF39305.1 hypothetical protein EDD92_9546 [Streptomyces sp. TLI_185]